MAKLVICGRHIPSGGGSHLRAYLGKHPWPGGGHANALLIDIGRDTVEVQMIDRDPGHRTPGIADTPARRREAAMSALSPARLAEIGQSAKQTLTEIQTILRGIGEPDA